VKKIGRIEGGKATAKQTRAVRERERERERGGGVGARCSLNHPV